MSHSPLPGPPRSRSTPASPAPNRNSDSPFNPLLRVLHAPLSAHHGHPRTRRVLALEQLKLNGALLLIRCFLGYVGIWDAFTNLLAHVLGTTGAGVLSTLFSPGGQGFGLLTVCFEMGYFRLDSLSDPCIQRSGCHLDSETNSKDELSRPKWAACSSFGCKPLCSSTPSQSEWKLLCLVGTRI